MLLPLTLASTLRLESSFVGRYENGLYPFLLALLLLPLQVPAGVPAAAAEGRDT